MAPDPDGAKGMDDLLARVVQVLQGHHAGHVQADPPVEGSPSGTRPSRVSSSGQEVHGP